MMTNSVLSYGAAEASTKKRTEDVKPYWVVPPGDSPFFDDWEAILLDER